MVIASLASSLGWKLSRPSGIQRRAPFLAWLTNGSSTTASSSSAPTNSHGAHFSHTATGTCSASSAATMPMPIASAWRVRKCSSLRRAPFGLSGSATLAEYTITRPNASSATTNSTSVWSKPAMRVGIGVTRIAGFDQTLVLLVVALLAFGLVMVYSASVALPDNPKGARLSELHFLTRQALAIGIGIVAALLALQVPVAVWEKWAPWLFVGALLLLAVVLLPFVSHAKNGARRWIPLGLLNFQPSELAKLAMTMYAASYMVRKMDVKERFFKAVW